MPRRRLRTIEREGMRRIAGKECGRMDRSGKETKMEVWRGLTDWINVKT